MRWSPLLAGLAAWAVISPALAFDPVFYAGTGIAVQSFSFVHDASASLIYLGSPTSILDYQTVTAPRAVIGLAGDKDGWQYDVSAGIAGFGGGTFEDIDYLAGQVPFSQTFSIGKLDYALSLSARFTPSFFPRVVLDNGVTVTPYGMVEMETLNLGAYGLSCGSPCTSPAMSDQAKVLQHHLLGARAGLGVKANLPMGHAWTLDGTMMVSGGLLQVDDSHYLRPDLGPAPNIAYRYGYVGVDLGLKYRHAVGPTRELWVGVQAGADIGVGTATFGAAPVAPISYPAQLRRSRAELQAGISGTF